MECTPCAVEAWRRKWFSRRFKKEETSFWSPSLIDAVLDIAISSLLVSGADEVMIPYSLVHYVENSIGTGSPFRRPFTSTAGEGVSSQSIIERWNVLKMCSENVLVLLNSHRELPEFLSTNRACSAAIHSPLPVFQNVVIPVPSGPISCKLLFPELPSVNAFYASVLPHICQTIRDHGKGVQWMAWMRSALSCRFEGEFLSPIRLGDYTASLLQESPIASVSNSTRDLDVAAGASRVVWEESIANALTPRWMETIMKTSVACGVPLNRISLSLCGESASCSTFLSKAIEGTISNFTTCSISYPLFTHADNRLALPTLQEHLLGINNFSACRELGLNGLSLHSKHPQNDETTLLENSREWMLALNSKWASISS